MTLPPPPPPGDPFGQQAGSNVPPPPPTDYPQPPGPPPAHPATVDRDGKLIAAGVMSIIAAVLAGGFGAMALALAYAADGLDEDMFWGTGDGWAVLFGIVAFFLFTSAVLALIAGVGCVRGLRWGKIMTLIVWGLFLGLTLVGVANEPTGESVVPLVWSSLIVGLAATGKPWG